MAELGVGGHENALAFHCPPACPPACLSLSLSPLLLHAAVAEAEEGAAHPNRVAQNAAFALPLPLPLPLPLSMLVAVAAREGERGRQAIRTQCPYPCPYPCPCSRA